jgi:hypothetical protein
MGLWEEEIRFWNRGVEYILETAFGLDIFLLYDANYFWNQQTMHLDKPHPINPKTISPVHNSAVFLPSQRVSSYILHSISSRYILPLSIPPRNKLSDSLAPITINELSLETTFRNT